MPALTDPWTLGGHRLPNRLVLAPLAGIGNWFVRLQAKRFGAGLVTSEMVSSFGLAYGNKRTVEEFLRIHPDEHPVSLQLFGQDADVMRRAAAMAAEAGADLIDLNMGCPVKKVCKTGAGAAMLNDPDRAVAVARAAGEGSGLPVTVKLRPGTAPRRARRRGPGQAPRGGGRRGRHRVPSAPRLTAALRTARLRARARAGGAAARAGGRDRRAVLGRQGPRGLRGERGGRGDARPRLVRQPLAVRAAARALRGRARAERGAGGAGMGDRARRGAPRPRPRRPLSAQVLPLVRGHAGAHQGGAPHPRHRAQHGSRAGGAETARHARSAV